MLLKFYFFLRPYPNGLEIQQQPTFTVDPVAAGSTVKVGVDTIAVELVTNALAGTVAVIVSCAVIS